MKVINPTRVNSRPYNSYQNTLGNDHLFKYDITRYVELTTIGLTITTTATTGNRLITIDITFFGSALHGIQFPVEIPPNTTSEYITFSTSTSSVPTTLTGTGYNMHPLPEWHLGNSETLRIYDKNDVDVNDRYVIHLVGKEWW